MLNGSEKAVEAELALFDREGERLTLEARADATLLLLAGEPIVGSGPFVMNTEGEIRQAILDHQSGRMGRITSVRMT